MRQIRQLHLYLGTFFAPAIFFFAFSGALQTFGLHESEEGSSYAPPGWVVTIASLHKDQRLPKPHKAHAPAHADPAGNIEAHPQQTQKPDEHENQPEPSSSLLLKCFVLLLSIGLMATAILGIYMALQSRTHRRTTWLMLAGGVVLPIVLIIL